MLEVAYAMVIASVQETQRNDTLLCNAHPYTMWLGEELILGTK